MSRVSKFLLLSLMLSLTPSNAFGAQTAKSAKPSQTATKKLDLDPARKDFLTGKFGACETKLRVLLIEAEKSADKHSALDVLDLLALSLEKQNRLSDSEPFRQKAIDLAKKTYGDKSAIYARELANMGEFYALKGEMQTAWQNNDQALSLVEAAGQTNHLEKAAVYLAIARTRQLERSLGLADDFYKKALSETEASSGQEGMATLLVCQEYALMLEKMERKDEAKKLQDRVSLAKTLNLSPTHVVIDAKAGVNKIIADAKKVEEAGDVDKTIESWKSTIAALEKAQIKDQRLAYCLVHLGSGLIEKKNYSEAQPILKKALEVRKAYQSPQNEGMARNLRRIGDCYMLEKNWDDAKTFLLKAYEAEEAYGADDATKGTTLNKLASSCLQAKDFKQGENVSRQLILIAEKSPPNVKSMKKMMATSMLAGILMQSGRMQEGMQLMQNMSGTSMQMSPQATQEYTAALKAEWDEVEKKSEEAELKTIFQ